MKQYYKYIIILVALVISFLLGKYSSPSKTEIIEKEKIVEVVKENKDKKEIGVIHETELHKPDGTREVKRTTVYANQERTNTESIRDKETFKSTKTETLPNHQVSLLYRLHSKVDDKSDYTLAYQTRLFSSFYVGGYVTPDSKLEYGLILSLGF